MSEIDHFIEEVTEEVRRDRLFALYRRYGWIAAALVLLLVGGAAFNEYRKAQASARAERLGDALTAALSANDAGARASMLEGVAATSAGGRAVTGMLRAAALSEAGQTGAAVSGLEAVGTEAQAQDIYRQIAAFKMLALQTDRLAAADRRIGFEALAQPGQPLRLLAEEQLALIDVAEGRTEAALARLQAILKDAEASADLQQRASQLIVALGGTPEPGAAMQQG